MLPYAELRCITGHCRMPLMTATPPRHATPLHAVIRYRHILLADTILSLSMFFTATSLPQYAAYGATVAGYAIAAAAAQMRY